MDAFELLKTDHEKVAELFKEIEAATAESKKAIFAQLKSELDLHAHIEEAILYPALENTDEARDITLEAYEEHKVVKDLLAELAAAENADEEWEAKLKVLQENVEHHVKEEEGELFSKAEDALGKEEIERLGNELVAEKARAQSTAPRPASRPTKAAPKTRRMGTAKKSSNKTGILAALANLVGLGPEADSRTESGSAKKSSNKKPGQKAGAKKAASRKASASKSAAATKPSQKRGGKKAATKSSPRTAAGKKASVGRRATALKAIRSSGSKKSGAPGKSSAVRKSSGARKTGAKKQARKR